ncbi:MAG: trimethylamine methyltransferase family protein, partial [Armatimonadota bacterium]|nr:trimethylamine methyltransferase family protein [Armatimonadota bacterium]
MSHITYQLTGGLSQAEIRLMHEQALGLIERVGLKVPHAPTLRLLGDYAGVTVDGGRVRFRADLVQEALAAQWY